MGGYATSLLQRAQDAIRQGQMLRQHLQRKRPAVPRGAALCWAHVEDTARGHVPAMEHGKVGESYIITGPPATVIDVLRLAERLAGIPAPRTQPPPGLIKAIAALMSVVERVVAVPDTMSAEYLRVSAGAMYLGSHAKARRELGFDPRPLDEGLRETLEYELARLHPARLAAVS